MWIKLKFNPGFSEDLTSWETTIDLNGNLNQIVNICRFSPREEGTKEFRAQLPSHKLSELKNIIEETRFSDIDEESKKSVIDDADSFTITVNNSGHVESFSAPVDWWTFQVQKNEQSNEVIMSALKLWGYLNQCLPYKGSYENKA